MMDELVEAPKPEVLYLKTLFSRMSSGAIRIPAFQRAYVWEEPQVIELLESVYRGFPVGSLLLWSVREEQLHVKHSADLPLPDSELKYPLSYVLDGLQRLTTLYAAFHENDDPRFQVVFDLAFHEFLIGVEDPEILDRGLRLFDLFDAKRLLAAQQRLLARPDGDELVDQALQLHAAFQDYMIPVVTIEGRGVPEVVEIFERVNSTGTRLSRIDFMRAVTWSEEFDLGAELEAMARFSAGFGFQIPDETLVKVLGVAAGLAPTTESLVALRSHSVAELNGARRLATEALERAFQFLNRENVYGYDYLPYEGQMLVLVGVFLSNDELSVPQIQKLSQWFRSVSIAESLRGKPDHFVARAMDAVVSAIGGNGQMPTVRVSLASEDLLERRFTRGKALSASLALLLASSSPRDLGDGDPVSPESFMREFRPEFYAAVLPRQLVEQARGHKMVSGRVLANIVLTPRAGTGPNEGCIQTVLHSNGESRRSQFISDSAATALRDGDFEKFLQVRAEALQRALVEFAQAGAD